MAKKKFGKFLLFSAAVGAVAAGAYYYLQNKNVISKDDTDEDDDFDDFSEDLDNDNSSDTGKRSYVSLDFDSAEKTGAASSENTSAETDTAKEALDNLNKAAESAKAEVEEFFDEDDEDDLTEE